MINLGSAYGEIRIGTGEATSAVQSLSGALRSVGSRMSLAITAPLSAIGVTALRAAGDFEQSMNQMEVIAGATEGQMAALNAQALNLGAVTSFSAGEAASAMLELAKAGLSVDEVGAAIGGTLDLAAAGGIDLARAAEIAANAVNAFNLPASATADVANMLAAAANASSVEVGDLAMSLQMSSAVFAGVGLGIDELTTALALLGNNGLKASDAGTSIKTMLMRLTAPTDEAAGAMAQLGIQVFNADGSMRSFRDIIANLETATQGMSDAQRSAALTTIFGADAIRAANILINEGVGAYDTMAQSVNKAGAAQEVASARMAGLTGALEYFRGSVESTLIGAAQPFLGMLAEMLRSVADLVTQFGTLPQPVQNAALAFAAVMAAAGPLLLAIPLIGTVLGALLSPIGLVVGAVAVLAAAWAADFGGIRQHTANAAAALAAFGKYMAAVAADGDTLNDWLTHMPEPMAQVAEAIGSAMVGIQDVWAQVMEFLGPALARLRESFGEMVAQFGEMGPEFEALWAAAQPVVTMLLSLLQKLATFVGVTLVVSIDAGINLLAAIFERLPGVVGTVVDQMTLTLNWVTTVIQGLVTMVQALLAGDWAAAWDAGSAIVSATTEAWAGSFENFLSILTDVMGVIYSTVKNTLEDLGVPFSEIENWLLNRLTAAFNSFKGFLGDLDFPNPFEVIQGWIDDVGAALDWLRDKFAGLNRFISGLSFNMPSMPTWLGGNAIGSSSFRGGMTMVGERGPELVSLPRGSRILTAGQTQREMAGANGMAPVMVTVNATVASGIDVEALAWRVAAEIRRRAG